MANGLVVRQGEPTIVVAVFENIARVHWKHKKGNKRHLQPPITVHHGHTAWVITCPLFDYPECCQKWQMGLLPGKESQPLLWQYLKTLLGSIGNTRKATKGIYNRQSQYIMAIPLGSSPAPFLTILSVAKSGKWACCQARRANHCCGSI